MQNYGSPPHSPASCTLPHTFGRPKFIQLPPCPYHRDMDSSSHMRSKGENSCVRYSLKWVTNYSTIFHRCASWLVPSPRTSGWWPPRTCLHSISKRCLFILVLTKTGADLYLYWETVDHRLVLYKNSKRVAWIIIPNSLIISPLVVPFSPCFTNCWELYSVIHMSWLGGKRRRCWNTVFLPSLNRDIKSTIFWSEWKGKMQLTSKLDAVTQ